MPWILLGLDLALAALAVGLLLRLRRREAATEALSARLQDVRRRLDALESRFDPPSETGRPAPRRPGRHRLRKPDSRPATAPPSARLS